MFNAKKTIPTIVLGTSILFSVVAYASPPVGTSVKIQSVGYDIVNGSYNTYRPTVLDLGTKYIYTRNSSSKNWKLVSVGLGFYNIKSTSRPNGCIYDSSGSKLAKFDSSCNSNEPRAEWKFIETHQGSGQYNIQNGIGRCLQVDNYRDRLKAVTCNPQNPLYQLFTVN